MGDFTCDLVARDAISHAAQVFQQNHTQGSRQGPEFSQVEFADLLIGMQESGKKNRVEDAVGVRYVRPGNAIYAR